MATSVKFNKNKSSQQAIDSQTTNPGTIYFSTDKKEIILDGEIYGKTPNNGILSVQVGNNTPSTFSADQNNNTSISITAADLGLGNAISFIGQATVDVVEGEWTDPGIVGYSQTTAKPGDVILGNASSSQSGHEYILDVNKHWTLIGYTDSIATSSLPGLVKLGINPTTAENRTYPVTLNNDNQMQVNVPWVNTIYDIATTDRLGLVKIGDNLNIDASGKLSVNPHYIPLTGTEVNKPVTGDVKFELSQATATTHPHRIYFGEHMYIEGGDNLGDGCLSLFSKDPDVNTTSIITLQHYDENNNLNSKLTLSGGQILTIGSIIPETTSINDLGASARKYRDGYFSGNLNASAFYESSDKRLKNIHGEIDLNKAYELVDKCSTILYDLKVDESHAEQVGMIAQEVEEFFPEIVITDKSGYKSLDYSRLTVIILKVMKDLIKRVEKLEK